MKKISVKVIIITLSALLLSFGVSIFIEIKSFKNEINKIAESNLELTKKSYRNIYANEEQKLSLALDALISDNKAKELFIKKELDSLFAYSEPLFQTLKTKYSITHFYYIMPEPESTCFLRVHNKPKRNDVIKRFTYGNSVKTKQKASGLELGKTAFALRVVRPYYHNGNLIGYMEVGQEIDNFFDFMKEETGNDFYVTVEKKYLNKEKWVSARESHPELAEWDEQEHEVVLINTNKEQKIPTFNKNILPDSSSIIHQKFEIESKNYILGQLPLIDAGNRNVGKIYFLYDISDKYNELRQSLIDEITILALITLIFIVLSILYIRKIIAIPVKTVVKSMQRIADKDIDFEIKVRGNDEISNLQHSLNKIIKNFKEVVDSIDDSSASLIEAGEQLNYTSERMSEKANEQAATTEEIATSMEQMVAAITSNTENAITTGNTTEHSASQIKESKQEFTKSIKFVSDIGLQTELINDIAFKTNILSLNAAIEAVRAGITGRGFAAVADEIRKLADESKTASEEITRLSETGRKVSKSINEKLETVIQEVVISAKKVNEIMAASQEQQNNAENINNSIIRLTEISTENTVSAEEMANSAANLLSKAKKLKELISVFNQNK